MIVGFNWISHYTIWTKSFCVNIVSISFVHKAFNGWPNDLLETNVDKTHVDKTQVNSCLMFSRHDKFSPILTLIIFSQYCQVVSYSRVSRAQDKTNFNCKYNSFLNSVDIYFNRRFISKYFMLFGDAFKIFLIVWNRKRCTRQFKLFIHLVLISLNLLFLYDVVSFFHVY